MSANLALGKQVFGVYHGTGTSGDIALYDNQGTAAGTVALAATERLVIDSMLAACNTAGDLVIFADTDGDSALTDGEEIVRLEVATRGGVERHFASPHIAGFKCPVGNTPSVIHPSGTCDVQLIGRVL